MNEVFVSEEWVDVEELGSIRWSVLANALLTPFVLPTKTSPQMESARSRGGRRRLALKEKSFYIIGRAVDVAIDRLKEDFELRRALKLGRSEFTAMRAKLGKRLLTSEEMDALYESRNIRSAAKRFVARTSPRRRNGLKLSTVSSCYSRYLTAKESNGLLR